MNSGTVRLELINLLIEQAQKDNDLAYDALVQADPIYGPRGPRGPSAGVLSVRHGFKVLNTILTQTSRLRLELQERLSFRESRLPGTIDSPEIDSHISALILTAAQINNLNIDQPKDTTMAHQLRRYFKYDHLPENLQVVSKPFGDLAEQMDNLLPDSAEKTVALRKLLESKDAAVRANLPPENE